MSQPIIIGGQRIGRFKASRLLFHEAFRFLWSDKEMLWIPLIALALQLFLIGLFVVVVCIPAGLFARGAESTQTLTGFEYLLLFVLYVIGAFTLALAQASIAHIVYTRVRGGDATLGEGIKVALSHAGSLFVWSCITSTVGIVLRAIAERSQLLMKIVVAIIGVAWSVLTYFVVPAIVIDKKSPVDAIKHSGSVFKRTWGETLVTNVSLGLAFLGFYVVLIIVLVGLIVVSDGNTGIVVVGGIIFVVSLLITILLSSVLDSVLRTILYVYANEQVVPENFNRELLESMLVRKSGTTPTAPSMSAGGSI